MEQMKTIILIGGAPTAGKSTLAKALSKKLGLPWISTDQIRDIAQSVARPEDYPRLFDHKGHSAEAFLNKYSPKEISNLEFSQGVAMWPIIREFIEKEYTFEEGFILEGVNILPEYVSELRDVSRNVHGIFLVDEHEARIREVVFTRGLWGAASTYPDGVKGKEVEWVQEFNKRVKAEAKRHNVPVVSVSKQSSDTTKVLDALGL